MSRRALGFAALLVAVLATAAAMLWGGGEPRGPAEGSPADDASPDATAAERLLAEARDDSRDLAKLEAHEVPRTPSGSIRLRLVDGDTRLPVAAAPIAVEGAGTNGKPVRASGATDANGNALVAGVAACDGLVVRVSPPTGKAVERREVTVREDETTDLGTIFTAAHGVIEGVVVDEKGAPLPKVLVGVTMDPAALAASDADPFPRPVVSWPPIDSATTDDAGAFRFEALPLGMVALRADLDGYRTAIDRAIVEKKTEPARVRLVLARGVVFRGRVEDGDGKGLAHALVEVGSGQGGEFRPRLSAETGSDGAFEIPGFAEGRNFYPSVRVSAPERTRVFFDRVRSVDGFLLLILRAGARLVITVVDEWRETPIADARVTQQRPQDSREGNLFGTYEATTDAHGRAFVDLPPGTPVRPSVSARGYLGVGIGEERGEPKVSKGLHYKGDIVRPVAAGETRELLLWMRHGPIVTGVVRDPDGAPLPRARVVTEYPGGRRSGTVTTDGLGEYRMTDVDVGGRGPVRPVVIARSADGLATARAAIPSVHVEDVALVRVDLRLAPVAPSPEASPSGAAAGGAADGQKPRRPGYASVRGRVLDPARAPLAGVRVAGGRRKIRTDDLGEFTTADVPVVPAPGGGMVVRVFFSSDGYFSSTLELAAEDGALVEARDVVLGFGSSIRGVVRRTGGEAVAFPRVSVPGWGDAGGAVRATVGREDGTFEIRGLAPGPYEVEAHGPGYASPRPTRVDPRRPAGADPIVIVVVPQIVVEGRVEDESGAALPQALVSFEGYTRPERGGPEERGMATTDLSGRFRLMTIAANVTTILASDRRGAPERVPVPAPGTPLRIVLKRR